MTNREIDAQVAEHCMGWKPPAQKLDTSGDRGWSKRNQGGAWKLQVYGGYDTKTQEYAMTLLEEITDAEFRSRYLWQSPDGEYVDAIDCMEYPPIRPTEDPVASKQLRDKMRAEGFSYQICSGRNFHASFFLRDHSSLGSSKDQNDELMAVALAALAAKGNPVQP